MIRISYRTAPMSRPARGGWIEIERGDFMAWIEYVPPRTGRVD